MKNSATLQPVGHGPADSAETLSKERAGSGSMDLLYIEYSTFIMMSDAGCGRMQTGLDTGRLGYIQITNGDQLSVNGVTNGDIVEKWVVTPYSCVHHTLSNSVAITNGERRCGTLSPAAIHSIDGAPCAAASEEIGWRVVGKLPLRIVRSIVDVATKAETSCSPIG